MFFDFKWMNRYSSPPVISQLKCLLSNRVGKIVIGTYWKDNNYFCYEHMGKKIEDEYFLWMPCPNVPKFIDQRASDDKTKLYILKRDNFKCKICHRSPATHENVELHIDHIIPYSKGGITDKCNLQTLCRECNYTKGSTLNYIKNENINYLNSSINIRMYVSCIDVITSVIDDQSKLPSFDNDMYLT